MEEEELDVAGGDEAGDVVVEELVDALEIPVYTNPVSPSCSKLTKWERDRDALNTDICPCDHCTSSAMSRLECRINWFKCRTCSAKRDCPSPPCFDVPNSYSKRGLSWVPTMAK